MKEIHREAMPTPVQSGGISQISGMIRIMIRDALSFYECSELYSLQDRA
jgi:hypothetical protein